MSRPLAHKVDTRFKYVTADHTNIRATFERMEAERIKAEQEERTKQLVGIWHTLLCVK